MHYKYIYNLIFAIKKESLNNYTLTYQFKIFFIIIHFRNRLI